MHQLYYAYAVLFLKTNFWTSYSFFPHRFYDTEKLRSHDVITKPKWMSFQGEIQHSRYYIYIIFFFPFVYV